MRLSWIGICFKLKFFLKKSQIEKWLVVVREVPIELSPFVLQNHFSLQLVEATLYPYKGSFAPTKTAMRYLIVGA